MLRTILGSPVGGVSSARPRASSTARGWCGTTAQRQPVSDGAGACRLALHTRRHDRALQRDTQPHMSEGEVLDMIAQSTEFEQVAVREEEMVELEKLAASNAAALLRRVASARARARSTVSFRHVSRSRLSSFSLTSDGNYVVSNPSAYCARLRAALRRGSLGLAHTTLCWPRRAAARPTSYPCARWTSSSRRTRSTSSSSTRAPWRGCSSATRASLARSCVTLRRARTCARCSTASPRLRLR